MAHKRKEISEPEPVKGQARAWCMTIFIGEGNKLVVHEDVEGEPEPRNKHLRYVISQLERAGTGTYHWQSYAEFDQPVHPGSLRYCFDVVRPSGRTIRGLGRDQIHFERRRGTRDQARDYCRKAESFCDGDGSRLEWGSYCNINCYAVWLIHGQLAEPCEKCIERELKFMDRTAVHALYFAQEVDIVSLENDRFVYKPLIKL